jgi:quercetin dioxygenase-like cupin family protein
VREHRQRPEEERRAERTPLAGRGRGLSCREGDEEQGDCADDRERPPGPGEHSRARLPELEGAGVMGEERRERGRRVFGGPVWGTATEDLNATILEWRPGAGPAEHVNAERDVAVVVVEGSIVLDLDGEERTLRAGEVVVIEKGTRRRIEAGPDGARYVTVHRKRAGLTIASLSRPR